MNRVYLLLLLIIQSSFINAQELCTTPTEMNSAPREQFTDGVNERSTSNYLIKVYFHVIRKTNGSGASVVQNNVQTAFNTLNTDFNPHGIYFTWDNTIDYINNDSYYNNPGNNIFSVNNHSNGVDIYLYGDSVRAGGHTYDYANNTGFYIGGYLLSWPSIYLSGTHVVSHQMGHVFGLYHTHYGTAPNETGGCPELVNGSNSTVCGDEIEDTPADPNLHYNVNPNTGQWLGFGLTDANGDYYLPDTHLIMSYTHPLCMSYFSTRQGVRMRHTISHSQSLQSATIHADEIVGPPLVYTSGQYDIVNLPSGVTVSWSLSDNYYNTGYNLLIRNYPSVGHCLIVRDPNHDLMNATLTAEIKYNGITVQTLQKTGIYAYDDFWGQYSSGNLSGNINYTHYFNVRTNYSTTVTSPNLYGATVTYDCSGATPSAWGFHPDQGLLYFTNSTPNTPVVLNVTDGCGNSYVLYAFATNQYGINVSYGDNSLTVTLNAGSDPPTSTDVDLPWTLEIRNATTGELMTTRNSTSRSTTISTAGWPKGMYVVNVTVGKETWSEKIVKK